MQQGKAIGTLETQRIQTRSNTGTGAPPGDPTAERFEPGPGALESTGKADVPRVNCGRLRVMVADDHEMLRNSLTEICSSVRRLACGWQPDYPGITCAFPPISELKKGLCSAYRPPAT
jgi:hypothetical protein